MSARQHIERVLEADQADDFLKQTAISPFVTARRQGELMTQWQVINAQWKGRSPQINVLKSQRDENLAGIVLEVLSQHNALNVQVLGITVVEQDGTWRVGPTPGSFQNVQLGYDDAVLARKVQLETWISRERSLALASSTARSEEAFKRQVAAEEKHGAIHSTKPEVALMRFLEACRTKDLAAVMAFQGGVDRPLPDDYEQLMATSRDMMEEPEKGSMWEILTDPESIVIPVDIQAEGQSASASLFFWGPKYEITDYESIEMSRSEDNWRVFVPEEFTQSDYRNDYVLGDQELDIYNELFPNDFRRLFGSRSFDSPDALGQEIVKILRKGIMQELGSLLDAKQWRDTVKISSFNTLRAVWNRASAQATGVDPIYAGYLSEKKVLVIANPSLMRPTELTVLRCVESNGKWALHGAVTEKLRRLSRDEILSARRLAADVLLADVKPLEGWPSGSPPIDADLRDTVEKFRRIIESDDLAKAMSHSLRLPVPGSALASAKYLGALRQAQVVQSGDFKILGVHRSGSIGGVSVRVERAAPADPEDYLVCVVQTVPGPRILLDIDLRYPHNTGRKILNDVVWKGLQDAGHQPTLDAIRSVYDQHVERVEATVPSP